MQVIFLLSQIYEGLIVPHGKVHHASKLPDACLQTEPNKVRDSDNEDEDDEHLDQDAIILPGAGLQLGDHLDQVGVLLEESPQPERDVGRVHLEFEHVDRDHGGRVILILTFFRNHYFAYSQVLPLGSLVSKLFLFFSATFPSHVGTFFRLQWEFQWENDQNK